MSDVTAPSHESVSVRLEGGIGDHILGLRVLPFIRDRYRHHDIVVYSDSAGHPSQLAIAAMSPFASRVVPLQAAAPTQPEHLGRLDNVAPRDLATMFSAEAFFDAWGGDMFTTASASLQVPVFDILAHRPELKIPLEAEAHAAHFTDRFERVRFVALNLSKYGSQWLNQHSFRISAIIRRILELDGLMILNMFTSSYQFMHWPERHRMSRQVRASEEAAALNDLCTISNRVVPCIDLPIGTIAALLARSDYFIGVDNGIKHLAWALGLPHTFLHPEKPRLLGQLRWMPDLHRMLHIDCPDDVLSAHLDIVTERLRKDMARPRDHASST